MDDIKVNVRNRNSRAASMQVSVLGDIPGGTFERDEPFLIKNITDGDLMVRVKMADSNEFITTKIYPRWNPELVTAVEGAEPDTMQYGY